MKSILFKCFCLTAFLVLVSCGTSGKLKTSLRNQFDTKQQANIIRRNTPWNDAGKGRIEFLDRHNIDCKTGQAGAISSFHLKRNEDKISYEYECTDSPSIDWDTCAILYTASDSVADDHSKSVHFLDRHNLRCPANNVLTQFQLRTTDGGNKIQYAYTCCPAIVGGCDSKSTSKEEIGDLETYYLDRQNVNVPAGAFITGFQFLVQRPAGEKATANYRVDFCNPATPAGPIHRTTASNEAGNGNIYFLDRHNIDCQTEKAGAITFFHLKREGLNKIFYEYDCTKFESINWDNCTTMKTSSTDVASDPNSSVNFLDRQDVKCPTNNVLTQFQLKRGDDTSKIQYAYTCCEALKIGECSSQSTSAQDIGTKESFYLDRQSVSAPSGSAISGFKFQVQSSSSGNTGNYRVDTCKMSY